MVEPFIPATLEPLNFLYKPHLPSPIFGVFKKIEDLLARVFGKVFLAEAGAEHVVPVRQRVEFDVVLGQVFPLRGLALRQCVIARPVPTSERNIVLF